ncbi:MAG: hypothetical protein QOG83_351 [Alphaproteobacteria bacterium]|nr:hypothetical protein [Alphaproteobacteria bacterium]
MQNAQALIVARLRLAESVRAAGESNRVERGDQIFHDIVGMLQAA